MSDVTWQALRLRCGGRLSSQPAISLTIRFVCFPLLKLIFHRTNEKGGGGGGRESSCGKKLFEVHRVSREGVKPWMNSPGWTGLGWKMLLLNVENLGQSCLCEDINRWHFEKHVNRSGISAFSFNHIGPPGPFTLTNFSPFKLKTINLNRHLSCKQQHIGVSCFKV